MEWNLWELPYFTPAEVACKCRRCLEINPLGISRMSFETMLMFQAARDILGVPLYGNSWCRCKWHNAEVGGVADSAHVFTIGSLSTAGDLTLVSPRLARPMTSVERGALLMALVEAGFRRFGIPANGYFIHADDMPGKPTPALWGY